MYKHSKISISSTSGLNTMMTHSFEDSINKAMEQAASLEVAINQAMADMRKQLDDDFDEAFGNIQISCGRPSYTIKYNKETKTATIDNDSLSEKAKLKAQLKSEVNKKFKIGDFICLRTKAKGGCKRIERVYQIKQIVWSMNDLVIKALVVKQVSGPNYNMFSMNRYDCTRVHVKYEPGLQFLSMDLPWIPAKPSNQ